MCVLRFSGLSADQRLNHAGEHRAQQIVHQILLRIVRIIRVELEHPLFFSQPNGRAAFDQFVNRPHAKQEQTGGCHQPPTAPAALELECAKDHEAAHNTKIEMDVDVELEAKKSLSIRAEDAQVMKQKERREQSKMGRVQSQSFA